MVRNSWKQRGPLFTEYGVSIRSVQKDQTGNTSVLHYLNDGTCSFSFIHGKEQFFIPLPIVLKVNTVVSFPLVVLDRLGRLIESKPHNSFTI